MIPAVGALLLTFVALLAGLIAADRRSRRHLPFPWLWTLPSVLLIGLGLLTGAARYPSLPNELPIHFDIRGHADGFAATTPFTAFFPVVVQALITAVLAVAVGLVLRTPYADDAPADEVKRRVRSAGLAAQAMLVLATGIDLALFLLAQPIWLGRTTLPAGTMIGVALSLVAGVAAVIAATVAGGRPAADDHWHGAFYADRNDRRLFVPKRFGIGWTVNLGRPAGVILLVALLGVPLLTVFLGHLAA
nr:DUF5808 domain-containing protein [uncultured Actinoplanes sp.]